MAMFLINSFMLKWFYFNCVGSVILYSEFCHLFLKQLGFNPQQIGLTTLIGAPHILVPLFLLIADKFRARKLVASVASVGVIFTCLLPLLALIVPLPTCFAANSQTANSQTANHSTDTPFTTKITLINGSVHSTSSDTATSVSDRSLEEFSETPQRVPWLSNLFLLMAASRTLVVMFDSVLVPLGNLAVITYLKEQKACYGAYFMWCHIGGAFSISTVALLSWSIRIKVCGVEDYGYCLVYIVAGLMSIFSMPSLAWFKFEYNENRIIDLAEVKSVLFNFHYVFMFLVLFYTGLCCSFQINWEFWYLDGLSASPLLMGGAALIRRPMLALSVFMSGHFISRIGELKTICVALLFYTISYFALSFTRIPWFVLGIDIFQAAAYGLGYCAFTVHFSKAGSKQCSGVILGKCCRAYIASYNVGDDL